VAVAAAGRQGSVPFPLGVCVWLSAHRLIMSGPRFLVHQWTRIASRRLNNCSYGPGFFNRNTLAQQTSRLAAAHLGLPCARATHPPTLAAWEPMLIAILLDQLGGAA
jgi:hypothetical protein